MNFQFDKLIDAKNKIINNFLSKPGKILPTYNWSDYLFYRNCFKDSPNIIPFQFMTAKGYFDVKYTTTVINGSKEELKELKRRQTIHDFINDNKNNSKKHKNKNIDFDDIIWFNAGNSCPIFRFHVTNEQYDNLHNLSCEYYLNQKLDENNSALEKKETIDVLVDGFISNKEINEINKTISIMMCYFWYCSLKEIDKLIIEKINENLEKIHKKELELFSLDKIKDNFSEEDIKNSNLKF
ncbi:MAG: hypothetical protein Satyrvirus10_15 [Satyrvirus sp.]|uniref:Uncharacterized protein n=1 Tax=Satyrvirus sp. TaxID=2487771 RepID=A0A3G5AFF5_9VIRU|nr:MAG: hypothetical protein Satyrvirus10_15 [Satyrvirus sp.]